MTDIHDGAPEPEHDAELFVEFANTLELSGGQPRDRLPDPGSMRTWLIEHDLASTRVSEVQVEQALPALRDVRKLIHEITERVADDEVPTPAQVRRLNAVLEQGLHYHRLETSPDGRHFSVGQVGDELDQACAAIAGSLAHYLADHDLRRLRICANDRCRWRFIDRSRSGRRRWCDMSVCGNRAKVARHRARLREMSA